MEARVKKIEGLLASKGTKKYIVPPYQRPYRWDPDDAEKLLQDVWESCEADEKEYFIGSMICIGGDNGRFEVVDGQQRLVTLTLILKRLSEVIEDGGQKANLNERVLWCDPFGEDESPQPTVCVRNKEQKFYLRHVLNGGDISAKTTTEKVFEQNHARIKDVLSEMSPSDIERLAKYLIHKVSVVFVEVDDRASSFRLFNVLNARGIPLNDADLLKNLLFEKATEHARASVEEKWQQMENLVDEKNLHFFLRLHINSEKKTRDRAIKIPDKKTGNLKKASIFEYFEHQLKEKFGNNSGNMLDELNKSAEHYAAILDGGLYDGLDDQLSGIKTTRMLKEFEHLEWLPACMAFLNKGHDKKGFPKFAALLEKVYMQSMLVRGTRDEACYYAIQSVNRGDSVADIMACIRERADNHEFEVALDSEKFYDNSRPMITKLARQVLLRVDEERYEDGVERTYNTRISVEHILPQTATDPYWQDRFSPEDHEIWLHKLGNLTLLSGTMNSTVRNACFDTKKAVYQARNKKCLFDITRELCEEPEWNMVALQDRHEQLKQEIKNLWGVPEQAEQQSEIPAQSRS